MRPVHLERVVGGRARVTVARGREERVQAVDGLRDVGHLDLVRMAVEDVEGHRGVEGVPQGDRLAEDVVRTELRAATVPVAPLVDHEARAVLGIVLAHHGPVVLDHPLDVSALVQDRVPAPGVESGAVFGGLAEVRVVVQGKAVHPDPEPAHALQSAEEALRPADVAVGGVPVTVGVASSRCLATSPGVWPSVCHRQRRMNCCPDRTPCR